MRGPIPESARPRAPPLLLPNGREDLAHGPKAHQRQLWATPHGFGSVGFHLRHIAGSTDRLMTYVEGKQLSETQMAVLKAEKEPGASREILLAGLNAAFDNAEAVVRSLNPAQLAEPRAVGRKQLPTTVIGLLVHIAEHTQRHVGLSHQRH
jgi:hypothetical protein